MFDGALMIMYRLQLVGILKGFLVLGLFAVDKLVSSRLKFMIIELLND